MELKVANEIRSAAPFNVYGATQFRGRARGGRPSVIISGERIQLNGRVSRRAFRLIGTTWKDGPDGNTARFPSSFPRIAQSVVPHEPRCITSLCILAETRRLFVRFAMGPMHARLYMPAEMASRDVLSDHSAATMSMTRACKRVNDLPDIAR